MRVACIRCKTAYDIPPEKLTDAVLKIRCSRCGHVFGVRKKRESPVSPAPPTEAATVGARVPPRPPAAEEPQPPPVPPPLPEDSFEEEDSNDIHWLEEIDIPKIEDVIEAVHKKMAATGPQLATPADIPGGTEPRPAPIASQAAPGEPAQPGPPAAAPGAFSPEEEGPPQPSAPPRPQSAPVTAPPRPPRQPQTAGERAPSRPSPVHKRSSTEPPKPVLSSDTAEMPPPAPVPPRRRASASGIVLLLSILLFAGAAGFVSATRPGAFAFLVSRLANPLEKADTTIVIDEPVVAAHISRPEKRPLFVITGWVRSTGKPLPAGVRIEGLVYGVRGVELASGDALCGILLTEEELLTLADSEIVSRLQSLPSTEGEVTRLPFMIVIPDPPRGIEGHAERVAFPGG